MALTVTTNQTIAAAGNAHIRDRMHILASELGLTPAQIDAHRADIVRKVITVNDAIISYHYLRAALEAFFTGVDDAPTD